MKSHHHHGRFICVNVHPIAAAEVERAWVPRQHQHRHQNHRPLRHQDVMQLLNLKTSTPLPLLLLMQMMMLLLMMVVVMMPVKLLRMMQLVMRLPVWGAVAVEMILKLMCLLSAATKHFQLMALLLLVLMMLSITKILPPQPQYSSRSCCIH
jgi:cation transport ATPase